jgi:hypothetical protein
VHRPSGTPFSGCLSSNRGVYSGTAFRTARFNQKHVPQPGSPFALKGAGAGIAARPGLSVAAEDH